MAIDRLTYGERRFILAYGTDDEPVMQPSRGHAMDLIERFSSEIVIDDGQLRYGTEAIPNDNRNSRLHIVRLGILRRLEAGAVERADEETLELPYIPAKQKLAQDAVPPQVTIAIPNGPREAVKLAGSDKDWPRFYVPEYDCNDSQTGLVIVSPMVKVDVNETDKVYTIGQQSGPGEDTRSLVNGERDYYDDIPLCDAQTFVEMFDDLVMPGIHEQVSIPRGEISDDQTILALRTLGGIAAEAERVLGWVR